MDSEDKSTPALTEEPTIKRQRLSPAVPKSTQEDENKDEESQEYQDQEDEDAPKPRGQPEFWNEGCDRVCEKRL